MSDKTAGGHPSFGVAIVTRTSSSPGAPMFQSDLLHRDYISLRIAQAERGRELNHDWVHPREELVEVRMSLAQWGALVSSMGIGSGVPVTLVRTESGGRIPDPPHEPRMKANLEEVDGAVEKMLARAEETLTALTEAIEGKQGVKAVKSAMAAHSAALNNARGNAKFAVNSLSGAAEKVVAQARADIESSILAAVALTGGQASIETPTLPSAKAVQS